ncbi:hypothetical protein [Nocardioides sp. WS12]|uniref:hypothetical protein n=1 Tax=Nocardioides sp. WS12 TaxID=2486272 RepID=UPI0015FD63EF|nr:hypothetical protein [Nocardioides sp. WS12]
MTSTRIQLDPDDGPDGWLGSTGYRLPEAFDFALAISREWGCRVEMRVDERGYEVFATPT